MKNQYLNLIKFSTKAMVILTSVCVLVSVFAPVLSAKATDDFSLKVSLTKSVDKTTANPGDEIVYTLNYKNEGTAAVYNVKITDSFTNAGQEYLTFISSEPFSAGLVWIIGNLQPGQSGQITIRAQISGSLPSGATIIQNRALLAYGWLYPLAIYMGYSDYVSTKVDVCNECVPCNPKLLISKSVDKAAANPGDEIVYTLNYEIDCGTCNKVFHNVVIKDPFINSNQNYLTFISANPAPTSGNDTWNLGDINTGQSGHITVRARISDSIPCGNTGIQNKASIDSNETEMQYSNDASTDLYRNCGNPAPTCSVSANPTSILNGQSSTLSWTSTNATSCTASNAWSGAKSLSGTQLVSPSSTSTYALTCTGAGGTVNCSVLLSVTEPANPNLVITKSVNASYANPNDEIIYTLNYQNTGNGTTHNVVISDPFDNLNQNYLTYLSATPSPTVGYSTWYVNDLSSGQSGTITIRARISSSMPNGSTEIRNKANIDSNETALTYSNYVSTWVNEEETNNPYLSISKLGRNLTQGNSSWTETVYADPGDEIEFSIKINSTGEATARNVRVRDELPYKLSYIDGSTYGATTSDITDGWVNLGNIINGNSKTIYFTAQVANENSFSIGSTTLVNTARTYADDVDTLTDTARVVVNEEEIIVHNKTMTISKLGRNVSLGQTGLNDYVSAAPGDIIEFSIQVANTSNTNISNVKIWDVLPPNLIYVSNTSLLNGVGVGDGITQAGLLVGDLLPSQNKTIKFRASITASTSFEFGATSLTNYGFTSANDLPTISDSAIVSVSRGQVLGVQTGPTDTLVMYLYISLLVSIIVYFLIKKEGKIRNFLAGSRFRFLVARIKFKEKYL